MKLKTNYDTVLFQKKRSEGSGVYYEVMSYNDNVSYLGKDVKAIGAFIHQVNNVKHQQQEKGG